MTFLEAQKQFKIRHYLWMISVFEKEINDSFPNLRLFNNNLGKQQNVTDALGNTTQYGYDAQGRLTQTIYADGTLETSAYDAAGNRTNSLDRAGQVTANKGSKRGQ